MSRFFLFVFVFYTILGCVPSTNTRSITGMIEHIRHRLQNKDYENFDNPHRDVSTEVSESFRYLQSKGIVDMRTLGFVGREMKQETESFMLVSNNVGTSTLGINNPVLLDSLITLAAEFHASVLTPGQVESAIFSLNQLLLSCPASSSGGYSFLEERVAEGTITRQQQEILILELNALLDAKSDIEIKSIINTIDYEMSSSVMSTEDVSEISRINAGIEGMVNLAVALNGATDDDGILYQETGTVGIVAGLALLAVGYIIAKVADYSLGETVAYIGVTLFSIAFIDGWGKQ